jgi:hypothetical protein
MIAFEFTPEEVIRQLDAAMLNDVMYTLEKKMCNTCDADRLYTLRQLRNAIARAAGLDIFDIG